MAKIHILNLSSNRKARVVIHIPMIKGSNEAGETYKDCWLGEVNRSSVLEVGTAPGNITQTEKDSIEAGKTIEIVENLLIESGGGTDSSLNNMVDKIIVGFKKGLQVKFKFYGWINKQ